MEQAATPSPATRRKALNFVVLVGVLSFFADFTYEGSRSIVGPFFLTLHASAVTVAVVSGLGELLGYGLRLVSGRAADATGKFWPITIFGYFIQLLSVPLLALAGDWQIAAVLVIVERIGKATRNPPRDVMLSHAGKQIGHGWAFGLHEALDQLGALLGPLLAALILAKRGNYRLAFAALLIPALICLTILLLARWLYPKPEEMESEVPNVRPEGLPKTFWLYLAAAGLVAAGFVDFPLIAFHFQRTVTVSKDLIPVFYAVAMAVSGIGSVVLGRLFDRRGFAILVALTLVTSVFAPLVFLGGFWLALVGAALWGLGMGVHESLIPAAIAPIVPANRRASAYGLFTAGYGTCWFLGSLVIGLLYQHSITGTIIFCLGAQIAAVPLLLLVGRAR
ncbi:MAG TPA: MFS transporter [Candidatus Limnocylindrales bacterium]|nr:MFS transporter [Candidatus Limnocylindrales bacterium]